MTDPLFIIVDLFCGAGGTTTGFDQAVLPNRILSPYYVGPNYNVEGFTKLAKVIACVNHDPKAIKSHWWNHPDVKHFEEDIRTLDLTELVRLVEYYRKKYPNAYLILWASLECTNFSKAKGGQPRDADSRTLADHLDRYIIALQPDYVQIENVVEFMSWGPLDDKGKPVSRKNGQDWLRWRKLICSHGYVDEWKELNSANFGAYTSRNRLFGIFARPGFPIAWPEPTHAKVPTKLSIYGDLKKWKAVKEVLNFGDEGESIFTRTKPLSDKTLERIYAGLIKYVANGDTSFISKYYSGKPAGKVDSVNQPSATVTTFGNQSLIQTVGFTAQSIDQPAGTVTTVDHHALVQTAFIQQRNSGDPESKLVDVNGPARTITSTGGNQELVQTFLLKYNSTNKKSGKHVPPSVEDPLPVISTQGRLGLVQTKFIAAYYGNGDNISSIDSPSPTLVTKDRLALIQSYFIDKHYGVSPQNQSIEQPAGTIVTNDKHRLVICEPFIMPTNYDNKPSSIEQPIGTITANRKYHYLVITESGELAIKIDESDSAIMASIKQFMAAYGIIDIKMRMLRVLELLRIQGFPADYKLEGNQSDQKKFIGNSVVPLVVQKWTEALAMRLIETENQKIA
jgi:DNA (cytosine-5)-methyltransferase 1